MSWLRFGGHVMLWDKKEQELMHCMLHILCESNEVLMVGVDVGQLDVDQQKNLVNDVNLLNEQIPHKKTPKVVSMVSHLVLGLAFSLPDVSSHNPLRLFSQSGVRAQLWGKHIIDAATACTPQTHILQDELTTINIFHMLTCVRTSFS